MNEGFEQLMAFIGSQLPEPVEESDGAAGEIVFSGRDPVEVVVHLTASTVVVFEFAREWTTDSLVARPRRVGLVKWGRLPETDMMNALSALIKGARESRRAKFRVCRSCGRNTPPELLYAADMCVPCAGDEPGTVH